MKFTFIEDAVWTTLTEGDPLVVDKLLCIPDPKRATDYSFRMKLWDGLIHFFDVDKKRLPSGLLARLQMRLEKRGHEVVTSVTDTVKLQVPEIVPEDYLEGIDLRDYQLNGANTALARRRGILWQCTNAGKGEQIAAICKRLALQLDAKGLIIVPNQTVLMAVSERLKERLGRTPKVGRVGSSYKETNCQIVVSTYQSLDGDLRRDKASELVRHLEECEFVLVDEVHHAASPAYRAILKRAMNAFWRIGFTGTADKKTKRSDPDALAKSKDKSRAHQWQMEMFLGPVIDRIENQFMIDRGYSAKPSIVIIEDRQAFGPMVPTPRGKPDANGDVKPPVNVYGTVFQRAAVEDQKWLRCIVRTIRLLIDAGKPPFVFSHSIAHLRAIHDLCRERDVACKILHGAHGMARRQTVLKKFEEQQNFAVLTSTIFDEGLSLPGIRAVIMAGARRAVVELLQRIGRGIRAKREDNTITIVDFKPVHSEMLDDQAKDRIAVYKDEGFKVTYVNDVTRLTEFL